MGIRKVVSHGMQPCATGPLEEWVYWHNNLADAAAESINFRRHEAFWTAWTGLKRALSFHRKLHKAILLVLLQTSRLAAAGQRQTVVQRPSVLQQEVVTPMRQEWTIPTNLVKRYGRCNLQHVHDWWQVWGPRMMHGDSPLVYVSGIQLFISFNLHTGFTGPWCYKKRWYSQESDAPPQAHLAWGSRCKQFLLLFRSYVKGNGMVLPQKMARANSAAMATWVICYKLKWPAPMVDHVDRVIFSQLGRQACSTSDLAAVRAAWTA